MTAPRRRLEPDARRQQILACAVTLFGERPYAEVSTTDIANRAGVARGLLNHYFGTKRELYLEVVRALVTMPEHPVRQLPDEPLRARIAASVDWFLDTVSKHSKAWIAAIGAGGVSQDADVQRILAEADDIAAERVLQGVGLGGDTVHAEQLRALVRSYGALVKAAAREWLVRGTLTRPQVELLLRQSLLTLVTEVFPEVRRVTY